MRKRCCFAEVLILGLVSLLAAGAAPAQTAEKKARTDPAGKIGVKEPLLDAKANGWWTDDKGLTWTTKDNGSGGINWHEAGSYCRLLGVGGFSDWRLPSIDELDRMYDGTLPEGKPKIRSPLELSQGTWWIWSGTKDPSHPSQPWALAFFTGKRYSFDFFFRREHGRVLCVRRGGE